MYLTFSSSSTFLYFSTLPLGLHLWKDSQACCTRSNATTLVSSYIICSSNACMLKNIVMLTFSLYLLTFYFSFPLQYYHNWIPIVESWLSSRAMAICKWRIRHVVMFNATTWYSSIWWDCHVGHDVGCRGYRFIFCWLSWKRCTHVQMMTFECWA